MKYLHEPGAVFGCSHGPKALRSVTRAVVVGRGRALRLHRLASYSGRCGGFLFTVSHALFCVVLPGASRDPQSGETLPSSSDGGGLQGLAGASMAPKGDRGRGWSDHRGRHNKARAEVLHFMSWEVEQVTACSSLTLFDLGRRKFMLAGLRWVLWPLLELCFLGG